MTQDNALDPTMPISKEDILDEQHWRFDDYKQRITREQWKALLINNDEKVIFEGRVRFLIGKSLGAGIWEISKEPIEKPAAKTPISKEALLAEIAVAIDLLPRYFSKAWDEKPDGCKLDVDFCRGCLENLKKKIETAELYENAITNYPGAVRKPDA